MSIKESIVRYLIPFYDPSVSSWSGEARLLRWFTLAWLLMGLIVLFSASYPEGVANYDDGLYIIKRQLLFTWLGLICFNFIVRSPLTNMLKITPWMILVFLGLIFLTLLGLGTQVNGATRWIALGPFLLQPSEFMKPFLVLQSAYLFGNWPRLPWRVRLLWLAMFGLILAGILLQPNLSTTALCGMTIWLIALASGLPFIYLGTTSVLGVLTAVASVSFREYQRKRITSFMDPWADPMGNGYQLVQSLYAVGSGGLTGMGYGMSQQKLFYLPIQYTDFIFSVFAEEFGFIGGIGLLFFLLLYATLGLRVAMRCRHRVKRLVAIGVVIVLIGQSLLNIGVATGALPTTGLPFPLFSYGGSSSLASLILAALIIRVARESNEADIVSLNQSSKPSFSA